MSGGTPAAATSWLDRAAFEARAADLAGLIAAEVAAVPFGQAVELIREAQRLLLTREGPPLVVRFPAAPPLRFSIDAAPAPAPAEAGEAAGRVLPDGIEARADGSVVVELDRFPDSRPATIEGRGRVVVYRPGPR